MRVPSVHSCRRATAGFTAPTAGLGQKASANNALNALKVPSVRAAVVTGLAHVRHAANARKDSIDMAAPGFRRANAATAATVVRAPIALVVWALKMDSVRPVRYAGSTSTKAAPARALTGYTTTANASRVARSHVRRPLTARGVAITPRVRARCVPTSASRASS